MPKNNGKAFYARDLMRGERFEIGEHSYGRIEVVGSLGRVVVGKFCSIAEEVRAIMVGHNPGWITTYPFSALPHVWPEAVNIKGHPTRMGDLVIGNDVWLGYESTLFGGVSIGHGAIVGAGAVVTKNVEPYAIVAGNPARVVGMRFSPEQIETLLRIKWWDWPENKIRSNVELLCSGDVAGLEAVEYAD